MQRFTATIILGQVTIFNEFFVVLVKHKYREAILHEVIVMFATCLTYSKCYFELSITLLIQNDKILNKVNNLLQPWSAQSDGHGHDLVTHPEADIIHDLFDHNQNIMNDLVISV